MGKRPFDSETPAPPPDAAGRRGGSLGVDLALLETELAATLEEAGQGFLREVTHYAVSSGGKRLRPVLVMLCAGAGPGGPAAAADALPLAVAVELLHTATLVHDDVIDRAELRRGRPAVPAKWGDQVAILAGNFLFSRAMTIVAELGRTEITVALGRVVQEICQAEVIQLRRAYDFACTEADYLDIIRRKSALLIAECCHSGALLAGAPSDVCRAVWKYGESMGIAFQIADDLLDLMAASHDVGKPTGQDIGLGLLTLPVLRALPGSSELRELLERRLSEPGDRDRAVAIVRLGGGIQYAREQALDYVAKAIAALHTLPDGATRDSLAAMAKFAVQRGF